MTTKLAIFCAVMLATFSLVFALPKQLGYQPVGAVMKLPESLGLWLGKEAPVTPEEHQTLGADTSFERKNYYNGTGDHIFASIVLAGQDMMTGIHRPERCLIAQGWTTGSASHETIQVPGFGPLKTTRLQTSKQVELKAREGQPPRFITVKSVSYYWFIGYTDTAATHEERVALDFRDRVFHGYNQRWAMVMLTSEITAGLQRFGRDEKQTDELMVEFIKLVTPKIVGESVHRHAAAGEAKGAGLVAALLGARHGVRDRHQRSEQGNGGERGLKGREQAEADRKVDGRGQASHGNERDRGDGNQEAERDERWTAREHDHGGRGQRLARQHVDEDGFEFTNAERAENVEGRDDQYQHANRDPDRPRELLVLAQRGDIGRRRGCGHELT
jgi:hypothetical protein